MRSSGKMSKEFTRDDLKHHDGKVKQVLVLCLVNGGQVPDKPILVGLRVRS